MGLRSELFRGLGAVRDAATAAVGNTADGWEAVAAEREFRLRAGKLDEEIAKAAARAKKAGKDGSHEDHGFNDGDNRGGDNTSGESDGDGLIQGVTFGGKHNPAREMKAVQFDPFDLVSLMGWRERPSSMSYVAMERTATAVPVIGDIVRTRCKQVETFCVLPDDRHGAGFEVRLRDKDAEPTDETNARCRELEQIVLHCGFNDPERPQDNQPLKTFAAKFVRDSLSFDQACFEVVPDRAGNPSYFDTVDSTTIRLLDHVVEEHEGVFAVQVIQGSVVTDFTRDELAFCIRNPRSGIYSYGYGESEIETLVREITGFLWSIEYNRKFFSQGSATKGILNFKGTMPDKHMTAFRRQWYAMVSGVANAWRTPITNAEELQWINLQMSNRDMEYGQWMDFLIKVACARFLIAPEEVNFSYGNTNQTQSMGNTSTEEKLKASKDLGLRPLVQWFFEQINRYFIWRLDPDYEVVPVGLDSKGEDGEIDLLTKQTKVCMTVDEARAVRGDEPMPNGLGECILDPTWLQWAQAKDPDMVDQAEAAGGDSPFGDDEEDDGGFGVDDEDGNPIEDDEPAGNDEGDNRPPDKGGDEKQPNPFAKARPDGLQSAAARRVIRYEVALDPSE